MFRHLDDTAPPEPTVRTFGAVLERSARLRRRRTISATATVSTIALALGIVIGGPITEPRGSVNADFSTQGGVAAGTVVPAADLQDVVYVSTAQGFALAPHGALTALAETSDTGRTWHVVSGRLPGQNPNQLQFSDPAHGLLWGGEPTGDGALPLWVTSNGGRDWTETPLGPAVLDVSAIRSDVWAVIATCFLGVSSPARSCPLTLETSSDGGQSWSPSRAAPPAAASTALSLSAQNVELARMSLLHAYILSFGPPSDAADSGQLVYTPDGGKTWEGRLDPCPPSFGLGEELAGSGTDDLWILCASQGSAQAQDKALYRSFDGGLSWALTAAANAPALSGGVVLPAGGGLPLNGYVSPYSLGHHNFSVVSSSTAWVFPDHGNVFETTDGGHSWQQLSALYRAGFAPGGAGNVTFVDGAHGWVYEDAIGLWHTSDGRTWTRLGP